MLKPDLRASLLARRAALSAEARAAAAERLAAQADPIAMLAGEGVVSGFWPIGDEMDVRPLMAALRTRGFELALPVVTKAGLVFRLWREGEALKSAKFGLSEPSEDAAVVRPQTMLTPLLGFDRQGGRIGYGKGYYDGAIAALAPRLTIGIAFACQEVAQVPMEAHDRRLAMILTENGLIDCCGASRQ